MKFSFSHFFGLSILLAFISCGTAKNIPGGNEAAGMSTSAFVKKIKTQKPIFKDLTIQSRIDVDIDDNRASLSGKIYIRNKEKIWVNVSKFGLTAARALITPDGFQAYEKLNKTYIDGGFQYFNNLLKVDFIDYEKLQDLMLGRIFVELNPKDFELEIENNQYLLAFADNQKILKHPKEGKYFQTYRFDDSFRLVEAQLKDPASGMELEISYSGWISVGPQQFPKYVKVLVKDKKTQKVELEYNNFTFVESPTPFEIPSGYKPNGILK